MTEGQGVAEGQGPAPNARTVSVSVNRADLERLMERFGAWDAKRSDLYAGESDGDFPSSSEWQGSDDAAVELLYELAALLGDDRR